MGILQPSASSAGPHPMGAEASSSELGSKNLPKPAEGISADKRPFRSRRLRSPKRPRQTLSNPLIMHRGPPEAPNTIATRRASIRRAIRTQCNGDPQLRPARKGRGGIFGPSTPETTASGCSRDQHLTQKPLAEAETPNRGEAQNHYQVVVLASIDLRCAANMGDWCVVSARVSASVRKGVLGSCSRAARHVEQRAGLTGLCCRGVGHERGRKRARKAYQGRHLSFSKHQSLFFAFLPWAFHHFYILIPCNPPWRRRW